MNSIREFAGIFAGPMNVALLMCAIALALRWRKRPRAANWLLASAAALLYLCSTQPVSNLLIGPLEKRFAPLREVPEPAPRYVSVLGSGYVPCDDVPVTAALDRDGLARIVEGVRLLRRWPEATLIVSGGAPQGHIKPAQGYELMARDLGVDSARIIVLDHATNTTGEAAEIAAVVKHDRFVLVTSAYHMPRAMREMQRNGLQPIPAPTAHRYDFTAEFGIKTFVPSADSLRRSEYALHEYLGLLGVALGAGA